MKTIISKGTRAPAALFAVFVALIFLAGCNSGESTEALPNTGGGSNTVSYSGPAPATDDVLNFKRSVWDELSGQNKCGACHNAGGQSPQFVHEGDINIAYAQANTIVNLSDPSQSEMVTKVAGGHNCWTTSVTACTDLLTVYISNWAGGSEGSVKTVELRAPNIQDVNNTLTFPSDTDDFANTIYPVLTQYCSDCHTSNGQTPYIASSDVGIAYDQSRSRIDLNDGKDPVTGEWILTDEASSRLVERLRDDRHNCWDADCLDSATEMLAAIQAFIGRLGDPEPIPSNLVTSKALNLANDGLLANAGGRYEDNVIALYEFKAGDGPTAFDTSGVSPPLDLTLSGNVGWVGGWGIDIGPAFETEEGEMIRAGKAQGSTADSRKLHTLLTASGEYAIEAWVVPGNITQEDARIVTYSGSSTARNFTLGQDMQSYEFLHRSTTTDQNDPMLTEANPMLLQATLQHVVVNFTPDGGREIFVNGEPSGDVDPDSAGLLTDWDDSFALVLGNETDGESPWEGAVRMLAIHNRALTAEQVAANYDVGVGQKFFLLFSVSHLVDMPESFIVFEVSQFDSYGYLFSNPFFISLDETQSPSGIALQGMRIGINGREVVVGQSFANLDVTLNSSDYVAGSGQPLSRLGTVLALENGPESDQFFLTFERIGSYEDARAEGPMPTQPPETGSTEFSAIGLKTFDEVNASMSKVTGIPATQPAVAATFTTVKQQLPTVEDLEGFLSSHQMAITQMAIQYCDVLVSDTDRRSDFFPGFNFGENAGTAFDDAGRALIKTPLMENFVGTSLSTQPADADIETELDALMGRLTTCGGSCEADRTVTVVKASCAAVLGSAVTLIQ
ncbi:LamG domain-containing protein [Marinobacter salarius]|uniref:LamG domain-containing protein n=1 Tax=Marinobacter salarius TaxID=1420917 RepID=UPI0018F201FF|nr:LamG domain-containing protein [Marinobacter salarius]MBJ7275317.1 LamG domain-containing protein [Marinobacter salarius]